MDRHVRQHRAKRDDDASTDALGAATIQQHATQPAERLVRVSVRVSVRVRVSQPAERLVRVSVRVRVRVQPAERL